MMAQPGPAGNGVAAPVAAAAVPIFLSGSHHREAVFGQEMVPAAAMIAELKQRRKGAEEKAARRAKGLDGKHSDIPRPPGKRSGGKASTVSVKELIDAELIKSGKNNLTVTYKGTIYRASLLATGQIEYNGQVFDAPSTFSVFVKRIQTPTKQGDDGWKSVHVEGLALDEYRQRYLADRAAAAAPPPPAPDSAPAAEGDVKQEVKTEGGDAEVKTEPAADGSSVPPAAAAEGDAAAGAETDGVKTEVKAEVKSEEPPKDEPPPEPPVPCIYFRQLGPDELPPLPSSHDLYVAQVVSADPDAEVEDGEGEEGEPDTNNWVQCTRCQTWRVVPDEFWPDIDQAGDEDWYCEEATWDLTQYDPFSKGCKEYGT